MLCANVKVALYLAGLVDSLVLVKLVHIVLQVLCRLGKAKGVKATVAGQGPVQPGGPLSVRQPQSITCTS